MSNYRILVVDDEEDLCEILRFNLQSEGHNVSVAHSAEEALMLDLTQFDLLLLDVMMGEISGFKFAKMLRSSEKYRHLPIIFLTALDAEEDMLKGFDLGADDYISKPFSVKSVSARVKAVMRRNLLVAEPLEKVLLQYKDLQIDLKQKRCSIGLEEIALTRKEFLLLKTFLGAIGRVFSRDELLTIVWTDEVFVLDRTIDVNITRLRKKIGAYGANIVTRLGFGYCFEEIN